jgi:L-amino acid N-acyltransferase YncA
MPLIRPSREQDLEAITAIYAHYVLHATATFELEPPSLSEMRQRRNEVLAKQLPYLVCCEGEQVLGYAYATWFKPRPAYRYCAEHSIYLAPQASGRGLGKWLLAELLRQCEQRGVRKLVAVIGGSDNRPSIALHEALGFRSCGLIQNSGWKFERWLDTVLMARELGHAGQRPPQ